MKNKMVFVDQSIEDIKKGFVEKNGWLVCGICGYEIETGLVYREGDTFYEAEKFMKMHIRRSHGSVFDHLIGLDKKISGLSDHQCELLKRFYRHMPDEQIQKELKIGSISTVRNHRFAMKERERQARIFMTIMELIRENENSSEKYITPHATATMVDDRYRITQEENIQVLKKYFPEGLDGKLKTFYIKEKCKLVVLRHITTRFESDKKYTEKEVNEILKTVYDDFTTIRRYLIEYGFMDRTPDCHSYWLKS